MKIADIPRKNIQPILQALHDWEESKLPLPGPDLTNANLKHVNLCRADLTGADLSNTNLANRSLRETLLTDANLQGANLRGTILTDAHLAGANLLDSDLGHTFCMSTNLTDALLIGANFYCANLIGADLTAANLSHANLINADLRGTNFTGAHLTGADLSGADLYSTIGNGREICSFRIKPYHIIYTDTLLHIGCQRHPISDWWHFTDEQIDQMDSERDCLAWWKDHKDLIQQRIQDKYHEQSS